MKKDTTNRAWLHSLRQEFRAARRRQEPVTINVEDAIFTRLIESEELLAVAVGLFTELSENKSNWLFRHQDEISNVRWALIYVINDREFC